MIEVPFGSKIALGLTAILGTILTIIFSIFMLIKCIRSNDFKTNSSK